MDSHAFNVLQFAGAEHANADHERGSIATCASTAFASSASADIVEAAASSTRSVSPGGERDVAAVDREVAVVVPPPFFQGWRT